MLHRLRGSWLAKGETVGDFFFHINTSPSVAPGQVRGRHLPRKCGGGSSAPVLKGHDIVDRPVFLDRKRAIPHIATCSVGV
jgi:hypothetical protein